MKTTLRIIIFFAVFAAASFFADAEPVYNRFNIHYYTRGNSAEYFASYANYVGHIPGHDFLKPNTKVELGPWSKGFMITIVETGRQILFEYHQPRMRMSIQEYQDILFSPKPVSHKNLSKIDQQGIETGQALPGMTKEGVKIALGYPAVHRTPSLKSDKWVYWRNRFATLSVRFSNDEVIDVGL